MPTLIGRTIGGRFAIDALVGEGAMGSVYRARQIILDTTVAVKVLHRPLNGDPAFAARFLAEARAASRINHPGSMRVIDFGEEPDGLLYIVMEYLAGKTLDQVLASTGPLPVDRIVDIASQILAALAVAHEMGIIHRDLKPENIMLLEGTDDEGRTCDLVKVCDFGVAKQLESVTNRARVTGDGVVIGTPAYMSPEQARGDALDVGSDLYAVGVMIFELMTGKLPFAATTPMGTALMHVTEEPTRPRLLNPSADERLESICLKAMRKRSQDRYLSAREMRAELRSLLTEDTTPLQTLRPTVGLMDQVRPRSRRSGLVVAALVLAAMTAAGAVSYGHQKAIAVAAPVAVPVSTASSTDTKVALPPPVGTPAPLSHPSHPIAPKPNEIVEAPITVAASSVNDPSMDANPSGTTSRRSAQRRGTKTRRGTHELAPPPPSATPHPALPAETDTSPKEDASVADASKKPNPQRAKTSADGTASAKQKEASEPEALPLPVFPDPPPPESDPFDAPR